MLPCDAYYQLWRPKIWNESHSCSYPHLVMNPRPKDKKCCVIFEQTFFIYCHHHHHGFETCILPDPSKCSQQNLQGWSFRSGLLQFNKAILISHCHTMQCMYRHMFPCLSGVSEHSSILCLSGGYCACFSRVLQALNCLNGIEELNIYHTETEGQCLSASNTIKKLKASHLKKVWQVDY